MRRIIWLLFFIPLLLAAVTGEDIYDRFVLDGLSDEFTEDENIVVDSLGVDLESDNDSYWGEYNDLRQIKVTWDATYLYVAVDACCWGNNVILYFDIYDDYGLKDQQDLNTWMRNFKFYNLEPDFFLATWDTNTNPQFWKIREGQSQMADEISSEDYAGFDTGQLGRSMEAIIPLSTLYYDEVHNMADYPSIRLVALITAGGDFTSGPDCAPDNLGGMAQDSGQVVIIDNYLEVLLDADGDGAADTDGVLPRERVSFLETPPVKPIPLDIISVKFPEGKGFNPATESDIKIRFLSNRASIYFMEIYNMEGKKKGDAVFENTDAEDYQIWSWDGRDANGKNVPYGIYIVRIYSESGEITRNAAIAVVK
ncbi:MAG: T9SS type A sorting domain-containing protein [Candidatus Cloacimonetes bacterium]|nr:T9SS type A sorting domain-containing protein [Candidatus Cloacimonadota bacterium]